MGLFQPCYYSWDNIVSNLISTIQAYSTLQFRRSCDTPPNPIPYFGAPVYNDLLQNIKVVELDS